MEDYKRRTIESYNKNAKEFSEKFKGLMDLDRREEFQKFMNLIPRKRVLELGCGSGDHAYYFSQKGLDVTCVDLSEEMIKICKEKNLKAYVMDIENLDFEEESFDGIWAVTSLLHVPKSKINSVIKKLHDILRGDGVIFVCVKEGDGELFTDDGDGAKRYFVFWREEDLMKEFERYFDVIESKKTQFRDTVYLEMFFKKKSGL